jgi:hypothetical protein
MQDVLGHEVDMREVEDRIVERFAEVFELDPLDGAHSPLDNNTVACDAERAH